MEYVDRGLVLEPCHCPKEGQLGIPGNGPMHGLCVGWVLGISFGVPAQAVSGGNTEAGTAHGLVTSVHKVSTRELQSWLQGRSERKEGKD